MLPLRRGLIVSTEDDDYFRARAIEERQAAADSTKSEVALIHEELARLYEAMAEQPELRVNRAA